MSRTVTYLAGALLLAHGPRLVAQHVAGAHPDKIIPLPAPQPPKGFQEAFARVGDDMYIAGQPTADALRQLRDRGVTTVVNLRTPEEMAGIGFDEKALVTELGMKYVYLPVRGNGEFPYTPATVAAFGKALNQSTGAVLLHCTVAWRASHLWAAYLIADRGMSPDSALHQGRLINLMDEHHSGAGRQPVEEFLGRDLDALRPYRKP